MAPSHTTWATAFSTNQGSTTTSHAIPTSAPSAAASSLNSIRNLQALVQYRFSLFDAKLEQVSQDAVVSSLGVVLKADYIVHQAIEFRGSGNPRAIPGGGKALHEAPETAASNSAADQSLLQLIIVMR